jgi:3-hydroxyisobutyrate dehydrogenase-like beta-hydroxyacid dehydrogenase
LALSVFENMGAPMAAANLVKTGNQVTGFD